LQHFRHGTVAALTPSKVRKNRGERAAKELFKLFSCFFSFWDIRADKVGDWWTVAGLPTATE
jgi:hypothetical protein